MISYMPLESSLLRTSYDALKAIGKDFAKGIAGRLTVIVR